MGFDPRVPGEGKTERLRLVSDPPKPQAAPPAATPGAVRAALIFGGTLFAHIMLGLTQPQVAQSETFEWAVVAFAAMSVSGLVGMYVARAEGFRTIMLTLQVLCGLTVIVLDSVYWINLVMG